MLGSLRRKDSFGQIARRCLLRGSVGVVASAVASAGVERESAAVGVAVVTGDEGGAGAARMRRRSGCPAPSLAAWSSR